ncbi:MAG: hypothetical protein M3Z41_07050 [Candidatus Eremiobacteraeota bacterium]|nr:hypothetical protein [Candidatus Eremiobacteraeota bacterium]
MANWSPAEEGTLVVSLRDPQGAQLASFTHELVAADSTDCSIGLDVKEAILVDGQLAGFKLWFSITSRSATPRRFEVDFVPHPSLRFPERKSVTLGPGEATAFEVPVEWNRSVRDLHWWNHPLIIEVFVPVSLGRRTAALAWDVVEKRLNQYVTDDDRVARVAPAEAVESKRPTVAHKTPGQLKYTELVELKKLEQAVVGVAHVRSAVKTAEQTSAVKSALKRLPIATFALTTIGLVAIALAAFFYMRPPVHQPAAAPVHVTPPDVSGPVVSRVPPATHRGTTGVVARPVWTTVASTSRSTVAAIDSSRETVPAARPATARKTVALAPQSVRVVRPVADRNAVVALRGVDAAYVAGGRAVSVAWNGTAQASATVQVLDFTGKIIASRTIRGGRSTATVRLPRTYHGSVSVQVIANGYHGERVVQSASLASGG